MEEYLRILTEQIRCARAREDVKEEIQAHIEDLAARYESEGFGREEALRKAVREMGDPVTVGVELDRLHRPQMDWKLVALVAVLGLGGLLVQYAVGCFGGQTELLLKQCFFTGMGFAVMLGVCFLDYSRIGKYAFRLYGLFLAAVCLAMLFGAERVNGMQRGMILPLYLFVPVYAGILYRNRGKGIAGLIRSALLLLPPVLIAYRGIPSIVTAFCLFFICLCMLLLAAAKGWFGREKKRIAGIVFAAGALMPAILGAASYFFFMADYQKMRIEAFLMPWKDADGAGYLYIMLRRLMGNWQWLEGTPEAAEQMGMEEFILARLMSGYGIAAGLLAVLALTAFLVHGLLICLRQRNQLGLMIGTGCLLLFLVQTGLGIGVNWGMLPATTVALPFLTYGGEAALVYYAMAGLLLSVYRNQNVLGHVGAKGVGIDSSSPSV